MIIEDFLNMKRGPLVTHLSEPDSVHTYAYC